jgi:predicted TIM-barrel fold metal-dependent hydrolase
MTQLSESTRKLLYGTLDLDTHELAPSHLWGDVFGEAAGRIAELTEPYLRASSFGHLHNPNVVSDDGTISGANVWAVRGSSAPGAYNMRRRQQVMEMMGVQRQFVFPSFALLAQRLYLDEEVTRAAGFELPLTRSEIRELGLAGMGEYNEWAVRESVRNPERLRPVACVNVGGSPGELYEQTRDLVDRGILAINLPAGHPPGGCSPASKELEPFWDLLEKSNIAVLTHVGGEAGFTSSRAWSQAPVMNQGRHGYSNSFSSVFASATAPLAISSYLAALVMGGVFERHPDLRFGAIEIGASWLGPWADNLDMWAQQYWSRRWGQLILKLPSEYITTNVRVTPLNFEPIEQCFERYPHLANSFCFSSDYPHTEGGVDIKQMFIDRLTPLGDETVVKFFRTNAELLLPSLPTITGKPALE